MHLRRAKGFREPIPARAQHFLSEIEHSANAQAPQSLDSELGATPRPQLRTEHSEREIDSRHQIRENPRPCRAIAGGQSLELLLIEGLICRQERAAPIGKKRRRGQIGIQIFQAARGQVCFQNPIGFRAGKQRMPG